MSGRSISEFTPPGFYRDEKVDADVHLPQRGEDSGAQTKKAKRPYIRLIIYALILVVVVLVIYMLHKKNTGKSSTGSDDETEHEQLVNKVSEEELNSILKGGEAKENKKESHPSLKKYENLDGVDENLVQRINPQITAILLMGKRTYDIMNMNPNYKILEADEIALNLSSNIISQIKLSQESVPAQPPAPAPVPTQPPALAPALAPAPVPAPASVESDGGSNVAIEVNQKKPRPKRGKKAAPKRAATKSESDTDSVKDLQISVEE